MNVASTLFQQPNHTSGPKEEHTFFLLLLIRPGIAAMQIVLFEVNRWPGINEVG